MKNYKEVSMIFLHRQHQGDVLQLSTTFSYVFYLRCYSLKLSTKGGIRKPYCFTCWFSRFCYEGRFLFLIQLSGNTISILPGRVTISICINISLHIDVLTTCITEAYWIFSIHKVGIYTVTFVQFCKIIYLLISLLFLKKTYNSMMKENTRMRREYSCFLKTNTGNIVVVSVIIQD